MLTNMIFSKVNYMISIIVPVYNVRLYLSQCIESIINQTISDWELILVDDGSTDGSGNLCDSFANKDSRIFVIHQHNRGVSSARNTGLERAKGEYVMFVDADDWIQRELCENLLNRMKNTSQCDLVISGVKETGRKSSKENKIYKEETISLKNLSSRFDKLYENCILNFPIAKLYRRKLVENQKFNSSVKLGEDLLFNLEYYSKCNKISLSTYVGYIYNRENEESATKSFRESDLRDLVLIYEKSQQFVKKYLSGDHSVVLKKRLCLGALGCMQFIFYSALPQKNKKKLVQLFFTDPEFQESCSVDARFSLFTDIPRRLCLNKSYNGLRLFYACKKYGLKFL